MLKVSFGSSKRSADYNFCLEFLIIPSSGLLKLTSDTHIIHFLLYARAALAYTKTTTTKHSLRNDKLNRPSETEEQRKERLRIRHEKDRARRRTKKLQEEKKRSSETEGHEMQRLSTLKRLKRGDENGLERKL